MVILLGLLDMLLLVIVFLCVDNCRILVRSIGIVESTRDLPNGYAATADCGQETELNARTKHCSAK